MDERLERTTKQWGLGEPCPMLGDVGARQYFRVAAPSGGTAVLVLYPDAIPGADDPFSDFVSLHGYVNPILRVPEIINRDDSMRAMLLEDVGDSSLEDRMTLFPQEEALWADRAVAEILKWIGPLTLAVPKNATFALRSFDHAKYDFEWSFCREHFFQGLLQKKPPLWLDRMMVQIHDYLVPRANYLAHRDFHVRNLMVDGDMLVTIDFQDARMGPATYDLASIMFDGYWDWNSDAKDLMASKVKAELGLSDAGFWGELNSTALQRNFKALGTYAFQLLRRGKTRYAPAIPRTLRHILGHFERMSHGEGVIRAKHWLKLVEDRAQRP